MAYHGFIGNGAGGMRRLALAVALIAGIMLPGGRASAEATPSSAQDTVPRQTATSRRALLTPWGKDLTACSSAYRGACVPARTPDVDCAGDGDGPVYVEGKDLRVVDSAVDPFDLDTDGDGVACELDEVGSIATTAPPTALRVPIAPTATSGRRWSFGAPPATTTTTNTTVTTTSIAAPPALTALAAPPLAAPLEPGVSSTERAIGALAAAPTLRAQADDTGDTGEDTGDETGEDTENCDPSYPDICVPPPPPDLNCDSPSMEGETDFLVEGSDPHGFDADKDGIGCATDENGNLAEGLSAGQNTTTTGPVATTTSAPGTSPTTAARTATTTASTASMASTGADIVNMAQAAAVLLVVGLLCVWRGRRS